MILVNIRMNVVPEKRKELLQAMTSLMASIRTERGCHRCDFYHSTDDEDELYLCEEWETQEGLAGHLQSEQFKVLLGAMSLLKKPHEMRICKGLSRSQFNYLAGMDLLKEAHEMGFLTVLLQP